MSLTRRRIYELSQRKKYAPLVLEDLTAREALVILIGSNAALERIETALQARPELLDLDAVDLVRELVSTEGVGRGAAISWIAAQIYAGKRGPGIQP